MDKDSHEGDDDEEESEDDWEEVEGKASWFSELSDPVFLFGSV